MKMGNEEGSTTKNSIVRAIKSRRLRCNRYGRNKSAFKILTAKPTGKRYLGRPRRRWEDDIRMNHEEIGISTINWVDSSQDRCYWKTLVNAALNLQVP